MKELKIRAGDENYEETKELVKKIIRSGLGLVMVFSLILSWTFFRNTEQASNYSKVIEEFRSPENKYKESKPGWWYDELSQEQVKLNKNLNENFFSCVKEVNGESLSVKDFEAFHYQCLEDQFREIDNYLQSEKINVHNLDIYLFKEGKDKSDQKRRWRIIRGRELYIMNFAKALLIDNLTKLIAFIQNFAPKKIKTKEFIFYSEVFIKVLIFTLLTRILRERQPSSNEEKSGLQEMQLIDKLLESSYSFLSWSPSFISILPPSNILRMGFFKWIILSICLILPNTLLKEYTEKNVEESSEKENMIFRGNFWFRILIEVVALSFLNEFVDYYFSAGNKGYSKENSFILKRTRSILLLVGNLISSTVEATIHWKNKFNEKAL